MHKHKTKQMILVGMFAAITCVLAQISIPLPFTPVPINMANIGVFLGTGILGLKGGLLAQVLYVLLGAIGLPVFSNFSGGLGKLLGPTGGYIVGYIVATLFISVVLKGYKKQPSILNYGISFTIGLFGCYFFGTAWYIILTKNELWTALIQCVFPFLVGDFLKIILCSFVVQKVYPHKK